MDLPEPPPSVETPPFERPRNAWLYRLVNKRVLPPRLADQTTLSFPELKSHITTKDRVMGTGLELAHLGAVAFVAWLCKSLLLSPAVLVLASIRYVPWQWMLVAYALLTLYVIVGLVHLRKELRQAIKTGWAMAHSGVLQVFTRAKGDGADVSPSERPVKKQRFLTRFVVIREQWFRQGAETWSTSERARNCLGYGLAHRSLYMLTFGGTVLRAAFGYAYMVVYLREFRRTNDQTMAVRATAIVHRSADQAAIFAALGDLIILMVNAKAAQHFM